MTARQLVDKLQREEIFYPFRMKPDGLTLVDAKGVTVKKFKTLTSVEGFLEQVITEVSKRALGGEKAKFERCS